MNPEDQNQTTNQPPQNINQAPPVEPIQVPQQQIEQPIQTEISPVEPVSVPIQPELQPLANSPEQLTQPTPFPEIPPMETSPVVAPIPAPIFQPVQPIAPQSFVNPVNSQGDKKKFIIIGAIIAAVIAIVIIALIIIMSLNSGKNGGQASNPFSNSVSSAKDVKNIDDAVSFAMKTSKYKNPAISDLQFIDDGKEQTYRLSVIDIDGYEKDKDSEYYYYPEKRVEFDSKGTQNIVDSKMNVYSSEDKKFYGYGGKRKIGDVLEQAKKEISDSGAKLGKTYMFEFKDSTYDDSDSWQLMWTLSGQSEDKGDLKATAVELKDSDLSVVRSGDATLYVW